jgi:hypothetical protein
VKKGIAIGAGVALLAGLVTASYWTGRWVRSWAEGALPPAAWAEEGSAALSASAKRIMEAGVEKGEVAIGERVLFRVDTMSGGLTGYERAMIAAKRLNDALAAGAKPEEFTAAVVQGLNVVLWREQPIITVDDAQAQALSKQRAEVAEEWAAAIRTTLRAAMGQPEGSSGTGGQAAQPPATPAGQAATQPAPASSQTAAEPAPPSPQAAPQPAAAASEPPPPPPEPSGEKNAPIISVGRGVQVGIAKVKGPKSRVAQVQAVALLETKYKNVLELDIYVPIATKQPGKSLARVQGVGVVGLARYKVTGGQ